MLTIVIPNRNRKLETVRRTLDSIAPQCAEKLNVVVVDYGSDRSYQKELDLIIQSLSGIELICCPTQGQLWNKSRAINIVLKQCKTPFFMVVDMDMLFHTEFASKISEIAQKNSVHYFQVGILTEEESKLHKPFENYEVKFYTNEGATGITLFPTAVLMQINGFDEFYHGWGAEDTDVHLRLEQANIPIYYYTEETLFLHQWHPKYYRSKESIAPYHQSLEKINHQYLKLSRKLNKIKANVDWEWGIMPEYKDYEALGQPKHQIQSYATNDAISALTFQLNKETDGVLQFTIQPHPEEGKIKMQMKKALQKTTPLFMDMETANALLLEHIIKIHRNCPYQYSFDRKKKIIKGVVSMQQRL